MTAVILTYLVLSIEPMVRCMLRRISDAGIFYCSENSLQCYNESAEPTAELIVRIRSMGLFECSTTCMQWLWLSVNQQAR